MTASRSIAGTIAENYLNNRAIAAFENAEALRFHARCPVKIDGVLQYRPAMLSAMTDIKSNDFRGYQAVFLTPDAKKDLSISDGRRFYGSPQGAVCKLSRDE